jgi:hypothetical protein
MQPCCGFVGQREEDAEVSSWRLLTIVNKFAELQTLRVTSPALTLLLMVRTLALTPVLNSICA